MHSNGASAAFPAPSPDLLLARTGGAVYFAPRDIKGGLRLSLSVRLLLLVLLAVIPAVCIEVYGEVELRASRRQELRDEALRLVRAVAAEQERIDEGARELLIAFSEAAALRAGDWDGCNQTAKRVRAQIEGYVNIGIANNDGSQPDGTNARRLQFSLRLKF